MENLNQYNLTILNEEELLEVEGGNIWWRVIGLAYEVSEAIVEIKDGIVAGWNAAEADFAKK